MKLENIPVGMTDWAEVAPSIQDGKTGIATARTRQFGDLQLRLMEYSAGYVGDHWCHKGHIVYVISGDLVIEHEDGVRYVVKPGASVFCAQVVFRSRPVCTAPDRRAGVWTAGVLSGCGSRRPSTHSAATTPD